MRKRPFGLPMWTPLFILFLLFLAGVWAGVNRHGLLELYHQRVYGSPLTKKVIECPGDGMMNFKKSRFDRSMNPFKAFLSWPGKHHKVDKADKYKPAEDDFYGQEEISKCQHEELPFDHGDHFKLDADHLHQGSDHFIKDADHLSANANHLNQDANQFHVDANNLNQEQGLLGNFQANKPGLVNSPMMDYKREFASDDANPYVESLQQRYEPLPQAYKD
ncbi:uncharacterized protein Dere_GG19660 [Drosophila erecta]|uniref:Uncharacterized protein n=1 Tax=Drosophila erecta TaxID=7220 RepID=B3NTT0_DROER|nr:uncharacterized protein Dere_GG19660 [Drosophila erecta]